MRLCTFNTKKIHLISETIVRSRIYRIRQISIIVILCLLFTNYHGLLSAYFTDIKNLDNSFSVNAEYTITFNSNGGTGTMTSQTVSYNISTYLNSNTFIRTGYNFTGWNTSADGTGTPYLNGASIENLGDIELFAQWELNNDCTVTFNSNGGTGTMSPQIVPYNTPTELTPNGYTKVDYVFDRWNTQADGSGTWYQDRESISITSNLTLYAQWRIPAQPKKGDYVNYNPIVSQLDSTYDNFESGVLGYSAQNAKYYVSDAYTGLISTDGETHNNEFSKENLRWRIWDIDDTTVRLVPETTTTQRLAIKRNIGFNNGLFLMNDICSKLYAGEVDGITAKNLTYKDIEDKIILNYATNNPTSTGYIDNDGKPIWSENNIKTILGLSTTYGQENTLPRNTNNTRKYLPSIFANENFNKTTVSTTNTINLTNIDLENDYANGDTYNPPITSNFWQGKDSTRDGTARPISFKTSFYFYNADPTGYLDDIDRSLVFVGNNYWVSSKSVQYRSATTPYFQYFVRLISEENTITQYVMAATNNKNGEIGSTNGTDGYSLRLRPIVTIDRSKFDLLEVDVDEWDLSSH